MSKRYATTAPRITESTLTKIRTAARRYVLAGGGPFLANNDAADLDEHIANVERDLCRTRENGEAFSALLETLVPDFATRDRIYTAGWDAISSRSDAAFQFGVCVGLELLAVGHTPPALTTTTYAQKKGGKR